MKCRHCNSRLEQTLVDLMTAPPSNAYLSKDALGAPEKYYPLRVLICHYCWLVQTEDYAEAEELFSEDYAYYSSISSSWLTHAEQLVATLVKRFKLETESMLVEVAANDGYLLQFVKQRSIPCYGIEPTAGTAAQARSIGLEIVERFFGEQLGSELANAGKLADVVVANNVLAHVPDINDFVRGFTRLLKPDGVAIFEFPHLYQLVELNQFDTIYHEHFSYLSFSAVCRIFSTSGLSIFEVEQLPTHGGSLRIYAQRSDTGNRKVETGVEQVSQLERDANLDTSRYFSNFQVKADATKNDFVHYLIEAKRKGLRVAAYGAAAKGNTLLNFAGIHGDLVPYVVDRNPNKQGLYLPGSRIPIVDEDYLKSDRPDRVVILPWNLASEIKQQLDYVTEWGGRFVRAIPTLEEFDN